MVDAARTEADTDYWKGQLIVFTSGTIAGQARLITGFVPGTDTITFSPATTQAVSTQTYEIWPGSRVDVEQLAGSTVSTTSAQLGVNVVNAGGTAWASGSLTSGVFASGAITATAIAADAIGASELAADAVAEIADAVWDEDATGHQTGGTFGQAIGDPGADTNTIFKATVTDATGATVGVDVAAVLADTGTDDVVVASINAGAITASAIATDAIDADALAADARAEINAQVVDALATDTYAEPGQGAPAATTTLAAKINYLYKAWRNKVTQTSTTYSLFADDAATVDQKATVSDDTTTFTKGEIATVP